MLVAFTTLFVGFMAGLIIAGVMSASGRDTAFEEGFEAGKKDVTRFGEIIATYNGELMVSFPDGDMARYERIKD